MSSFCLINEKEQKIEYYSSHALVYKYLMEGVFDMSQIEKVGDISSLLDDLRYRGILIYEVDKINNAQGYEVEVKVGASTLNFDSIYAAVQYCQINKLSVAGESYIKSALMKNLMGKTKSAYGLNWVFKIKNLDISNYKIEVII